MPRLSVIIPAFDHLPDVSRCYRAVLDTTDRALTEVLIQDDASTTYNGPQIFGAEVCQRNSPNLGFAGNCNAGVVRSSDDYVLLLNQDCFVEQAGWDRVLIDFFDAHERVGVIGPTLLFPNGHVQSVGGFFDQACQPFHEHIGASNPDWAPIAKPRQVQWVTGAAFAVRRSLWGSLGGFDTVYGRGYFEDVDFCVRAQLAGFEVWHLPTVRMTHHVGSTGGNPAFAQNAQTFKVRWVDTGTVQPDVPFIKVRFWV